MRSHYTPDLDSFGVYCIENVTNGRFYIGNTSMPFSERFRRHRINLQHGKHMNRLLQKEWKLYGADAFQFGVLEVVESITDLLARELYWLAFHLRLCPRDDLYNMSRVDEAIVTLAQKGETAYDWHPVNYDEAVRRLGSDGAECAAVARMIEHKATAEKPTKASCVWAGFGAKKGSSAKYQRASLIYDTLFLLPVDEEHPRYQQLNDQRQPV